MLLSEYPNELCISRSLRPNDSYEARLILKGFNKKVNNDYKEIFLCVLKKIH